MRPTMKNVARRTNKLSFWKQNIQDVKSLTINIVYFNHWNKERRNGQLWEELAWETKYKRKDNFIE